MITKATAKPGRPLRSKTSYANQISRLKNKIKDHEANKEELVRIIHDQSEQIDSYLFPKFVDRVKYLLRGEL